MGVAVLEHDELVFWGVSGFRECDVKPLLDSVERRLGDLILRYQPEVIAIEQPSRARLKASPFLGVMTGQISMAVVEAGLRFLAHDALDVRKRMCGSAKATRAQMAEQIVERFPHLERYQEGASSWQESYWMPMFAAVGVGVVCDEGVGGAKTQPATDGL